MVERPYSKGITSTNSGTKLLSYWLYNQKPAVWLFCSSVSASVKWGGSQFLPYRVAERMLKHLAQCLSKWLHFRRNDCIIIIIIITILSSPMTQFWIYDLRQKWRCYIHLLPIDSMISLNSSVALSIIWKVGICLKAWWRGEDQMLVRFKVLSSTYIKNN